MDYGFTHDGRVFTPNGTRGISPDENEARNVALEQAELLRWATKPDRFCAYHHDGHAISTWKGTQIGTVINSHDYRNNFGHRERYVHVRGNNGAFYHARYGYERSHLVRLRRYRG